MRLITTARHSKVNDFMGNVYHTSDAKRPISTLTRSALDLKCTSRITSVYRNSTRTKTSNILLGNVDNTSDVNKPISTATQSALDLKAPIANSTFTGTINGIAKSMISWEMDIIQVTQKSRFQL